MLLGCIADDFTGASDLANTLTAGGMRTVQPIGVPDRPVSDADAVVIALKSRSIDPAEAVKQSLGALAWLQSQGATQILFKYCSTFDSTPAGNIGPVTQVLLDQLGEDQFGLRRCQLSGKLQLGQPGEVGCREVDGCLLRCDLCDRCAEGFFLGRE